VSRNRFTVRLLGTFEVARDGSAPVRLWPKPRALLAQLLVADAPVPMRRIVAELWPREAPESATVNVRGYVHLIRRALGADVVQTWHDGVYGVRLPEAQVDHRMFLDLLDRSRAAGVPHERTVLLRRALALCDGPVLSNVPHGPMLGNWAASVRDRRRRALLDLAELLIHGGRCGDAQRLLRSHLLEQAGDETAYLLLMQALYAEGDGGGALDVYRQAYRELARIGMLPGPRLSAAQNAVLNHHPLPAGS
jgi:DNA-binding SARP family transcriptional activator